MSKAKKTAKKELRSKISEQLSNTFENLKQGISEKKFNRKISKASKILTQGIKPAGDTNSVIKGSVKKSAKKQESSQAPE